VSNGLPVNPEIVASSDGTPGQRHALARAPVIDDTLQVWVIEAPGAIPELWTRIPSLIDSGSNDLHYFVRRDENDVVYLEFGDGTFGQIPRRGLNNIVAVYAVGGGTKGNVPAYAISKPVTTIDQLKLVANQSAAGGTDAESTTNAVQRGPLLFRSMGRAVTETDYEVLAKTFGVGKAIAKATNWNNIALIVAPEGGGIVSDTLKQDLLAFLDTKRIMTSLVQIVDPSYVQVLLDATVTVLPQFSQRAVQQQVIDAVTSLFAFDNVAFGQTVFISKVYEVIQDLPGVLGVSITKFARKDAFDSKQPIPMSGTLLFTAQLGELSVWTGFTVAQSLPTVPDGTVSYLVMTGGVSNG
jgi:predicted phage baseplate assembly protein